MDDGQDIINFTRSRIFIFNQPFKIVLRSLSLAGRSRRVLETLPGVTQHRSPEFPVNWY